MKKIPPHLPSPFCDIKDHHALQRLKMILAAAVFGYYFWDLKRESSKHEPW